MIYSYSCFGTGLRIFEELLEVDYLVWNSVFVYTMYVMIFYHLSACFRLQLQFIILYMQPRSCSRAMKAVGVVEATCEEIFELVMSMDRTRFE